MPAMSARCALANRTRSRTSCTSWSSPDEISTALKASPTLARSAARLPSSGYFPRSKCTASTGGGPDRAVGRAGAGLVSVTGGADSHPAAAMATSAASATPATARNARRCDWLPQVVIWCSLSDFPGNASGRVPREGPDRAVLSRRRGRGRTGGRARPGPGGLRGPGEAGRRRAAAPARLARAASLPGAGRKGRGRAARGGRPRARLPRRRWLPWVPWLAVLLATVPLAWALRVAFGRPGPDEGPVQAWSQGAYPSGGALLVALGWIIGGAVTAWLRPSWRRPLLALAALALAAHLFARVAVGDHWLTDVVGSYLLAAGAALLADKLRPRRD